MKKSERVKSKIYQKAGDMAQQLAAWHAEGRKVVFTNGCFDLLHLGHVDYLSRAADLGDLLVVGLNTDKSVSNIKGPHRPITDEVSRASILASLFFVDAVVLFDEPTPYELIRKVQPDVLVKGADYKIEQIVGHDIVQARGGRVETLNFIDGYSTSLIEARIRAGHKQGGSIDSLH